MNSRKSVFAIRSIQTKIVLWAGLPLLGVTLALISVSAYTLRSQTILAAERAIQAQAQIQADLIEADIGTALDGARAMANALAAIKDPDQPISLTRDQVNGMLRSLLEQNPDFLGTYTLWEPDAFDGQDAQYANTPTHDETGRFIPYWVRGDDGSIHVDPLVEYETPGIGDWYLRPRATKNEVVIPPFFYPIQGKDVLLTSLVVPIVKNDTFYGIAGVDLPIGFVQQIVDQVDLYEGQAQATLITNEGVLAGVGGRPELANQPADAIYANYPDLRSRLDAGEPFSAVSPDGQMLQVFAPVDFGSTGIHWNVGVNIPYAVITRQANAVVARQLTVGLSLTFFGLVLLWFLARRIARPVQSLTTTAQAITAGDLNATATVRSADELGILANAFNQMTARLRDLITGLEQRVAQRTQALATSSDVSRRLSTILNVQELVVAVVEDVQKAFDYYHVHIYLLDDTGQRLLMAGGTGEPGRVMLARRHEIAVGRGLVGRAAATRQPVLVPDVSAEPGWLPNPLLPETRAEAAVPILLGQQLLGILDVQDDVIGGLSVQDVEMLQAISNQVAIAMQNANQVAATQNALVAAREAQASARLLSEFAPEAIVVVDADTGLYTEPNENAVRLFGISREQLLTAGPAQVSPEYQPDGVLSAEKAAALLQEALDGKTPVFEWTHRNAEGHLIPCEMRLVRLPAAGRRLIRASITDITERVQAQQAIARQAQQLALVSQIATRTAAETDPQRLLSTAAEQLKTGFELYHAQVYQLNPAGNTLMLVAGAGEAGKQMLARSWQIPLDRVHSLVARSAREAHGLLVNDVRSEPDFQSNPFLPATAAEMAVPLLASGRLLGVLDLQSDHPGAFTAADLAIHSTLAAQLAIALQNANQFEATRQSERLVRTIIDTTPDWIYIKDKDHRYLLVNQAFAEAFGVPAQTMLGKDDLQLGLPEFVVKGDPARGWQGFWAEDRRVLDSGMPQLVTNQRIPLGAAARIFDVYKVPLLDSQGASLGIVTFARDVTERQRLQQETQDRLAEIDSLYRSISRQSWADFQRSGVRQMAFSYDRSQVGAPVAPAGDRWSDEISQAVTRKSPVLGGNGQPVLAAPLMLRGDPLGALAVELDPSRPLTPEENELLAEMAEQVALAIESVRLFEQTQIALGETETLYNIIAEMNQARGYQDILTALASRTLLGRADSLLLMAVFNRPKAEGQSPVEAPEWIIPVAWTSVEPLQIAARYPLNAFEPTPDTLYTTRPVVMSDLAREARLDRITRTLFQDVFRARSSLILPLLLGGQSIGFVQGYFSQPTTFSDDDIQRLVAVAGQAAIAVQSRLLLEQAQARARQEQRIRQVSAQVSSAADVDTILRRAVEQVGRALGASAYIYLGSPQPAPESPASTVSEASTVSAASADPSTAGDPASPTTAGDPNPPSDPLAGAPE